MMWCNRFVFIHIPRTGGDSLTKAFQFQIEVSRDMYQWKHARASDVRATICSEIWDGAFKFTVLRHPWDLVCSWYNHCRTWHDAGDPSFATMSWRRYAARVAAMSFPRFVDMEMARLCGGGYYDFYANAGGVEALTLSQAHARLCEELKVDVPLPHVNGSQRYLNGDWPKVRAIVEAQCCRDIDLWETITA